MEIMLKYKTTANMLGEELTATTRVCPDKINKTQTQGPSYHYSTVKIRTS